MVENNFALSLQQAWKGYQDTEIVVTSNDADVNLLTIEVYNNSTEITYSELSSGTITFIKDDGNIVQGNLTINAGNITYLMGTNEIAIPGTVRASIQLYGALGERLTPAKFRFKVETDLSSASATPSTTDLIAIASLNSAYSAHNANTAKHRFNILDFDCPIDGTTNILTALKSALAAATIFRGEVFLPNLPSGYTLDTTAESIIVPTGVSITMEKAARYNGMWVDHDEGGTIKIVGDAGNVNGNPVFILYTGSAIKNIGFYWPNQTPTNPPVSFPYLIQFFNNNSADIEIGNIFLYNCFRFLDMTGGHIRAYVHDIYGDIYNMGINVDNGLDVDRIRNIHFWPFSSENVAISTYRANNAKGLVLARSDGFQGENMFFFGLGTALELGSATASVWGQITNLITDCCRYGVNSVHPSTNAGFSIVNFKYAMDPIKQAVWTVATSYVFIIGHADGNLKVDNLDVWGGPNALFYAGVGFTSPATFRINTANVMNVADAQLMSHVGTGFIYLKDLYSPKVANLINYGAGASSVTFENPNTINEVSGGATKSIFKKYNVWDAAVVDIASATTATLPVNGDFFNITGTTNITSVTASRPGRMVVLKFADILTFTDGSNLKIAGDLVTSADDTISLVCDGTNWYEVCRSVN
jgi:hypothetical protein